MKPNSTTLSGLPRGVSLHRPPHKRLDRESLSTDGLDPRGVTVGVLPGHYTSVPTFALGGLDARSKVISRHEATVGLVASRRGLADDELVERDARSSNLEDGGLGPLTPGLGEKVVAGGVFGVLTPLSASPRG